MVEVTQAEGTRRELLARLAGKYAKPRDGIHVSDLIHCLTVNHWNRMFPQDTIPDQTLMYFAAGWGLEEVLLQDEGGFQPEVLYWEGIHLTRDYITHQGHGLDLKTTRMSPADSGEPKRGWPDPWMRQLKAYSYVETMMEFGDIPANGTTYAVAIFYIIQGQLSVLDLHFSLEELMENWDWIQERKRHEVVAQQEFEREKNSGNILMDFPIPYQWNEPWECKTCRFKQYCELWQEANTEANRESVNYG